MSRQLEKTSSTKFIKYIFYLFVLLNVQSCKTYKLTANKEDIPKQDFDINLVSESPNYSEIKYWVEHPQKEMHYASMPKNYIALFF